MVIVMANLTVSFEAQYHTQGDWGMFVRCFPRGLSEERRFSQNGGGPISQAGFWTE